MNIKGDFKVGDHVTITKVDSVQKEQGLKPGAVGRIVSDDTFLVVKLDKPIHIWGRPEKRIDKICVLADVLSRRHQKEMFT